MHIYGKHPDKYYAIFILPNHITNIFRREVLLVLKIIASKHARRRLISNIAHMFPRKVFISQTSLLGLNISLGRTAIYFTAS